VVYGVDADLRFADRLAAEVEQEHIRRLGEILHMLLETGLIAICTAIDLSDAELRRVRTLIEPLPMVTIGIGDARVTDVDLSVKSPFETALAVSRAVALLKSSSVVSGA